MVHLPKMSFISINNLVELAVLLNHTSLPKSVKHLAAKARHFNTVELHLSFHFSRIKLHLVTVPLRAGKLCVPYDVLEASPSHISSHPGPQSIAGEDVTSRVVFLLLAVAALWNLGVGPYYHTF